MNIKLAWNFDFDCYKSLFPDITMFSWNDDLSEKIDLLVFPGGEDVSLDYYSSRDAIREYENLCYTNKERDRYEQSILDACYMGDLNVNKILGVCRGMQFINVMFDGKLFQDINLQVGYSHEKFHPIYHKMSNNLKFMGTVNSLHHQGIRTIGGYNRAGNRSYPHIIATDKGGYVPEIVTWENDRILGVQFHPEYYWDENPDKAEFREFCYSWVNGKSTILL